MANYQQTQSPSRCCFQDWLTQQRQELDETQQELARSPHNTENLRRLVDKMIENYEVYTAKRAMLARQDATSFFSPSWCTAFERSFLWIGGCQATLSIQLVYSLCGSDLDSRLVKFLQGERRGNLAELSPSQFKSIDALHAITVKGEDKLSSKLATLQEKAAEEPFVTFAHGSGEVGDSNEDVDRALEDHLLAMSNVLIAADRHRLNTMKEVVQILTPTQAAEFLVASKRLHLSMHEWSQRKEQTPHVVRPRTIPQPTPSPGQGSNITV